MTPHASEPAPMHHRLCVIHSFDPRGAKVGGLETFIRDMLAFAPDDFSFLMIGVDAIGDQKLGKVTKQTFRGKSYDFLPVLHFPDDKAREAATSVGGSITFQFMKGLLKYLPAVRRTLSASNSRRLCAGWVCPSCRCCTAKAHRNSRWIAC
jgi:hypothetical protein